MALNLIGLGLNKNSISADALKKILACDKVYLENYTVNFPYSKEDLEGSLGVKIEEKSREKVEDESIVTEAQEKEIALLVYGDALSATTHTELLLACKKQNISYNVYQNASIMLAVAKTGLQLYKFGKTASMPNWKEHTNKPTSFMKYVKENQKNEAHTLILTDIGLSLKNALIQLEESAQEPLEKIIILSNAGTENEKIYYDTIENLKDKEIAMPFCLIIPSKLHFLEEEALNEFKEN